MSGIFKAQYCLLEMDWDLLWGSSQKRSLSSLTVSWVGCFWTPYIRSNSCDSWFCCQHCCCSKSCCCFGCGWILEDINCYEPRSTRLLDMGVNKEFCSEFWSTESVAFMGVKPWGWWWWWCIDGSDEGGKFVIGDTRLGLPCISAIMIEVWWCEMLKSPESPRFSFPFTANSSSELVLGVANFPLLSWSALSLWGDRKKNKTKTCSLCNAR